MRRVLTVLGVLAGLMLAAVSPVAAGDAEVGMVDTSTGRWHLREPNGSDRSFFYGNPRDIPLLGDWNCDGVDTPGMFRPGNGFFYLTNANPPNGGVAVAEISFFFGIAGDRPIAGDWDGDGCDTVGIYRKDKVFLSDKLATGNAYREFFFGVRGDRPFAGDWDGDGIDTVGIYRNATGQIFYTNENPVGPIASTANDFFYGIPTDQFMPGDWDGNGSDTVGIFRPSESQFYLRNTNSTGPADEQFVFGQSSWAPLGGDLELRGATISGSPIDFGPVGVNGSRTANLELSFGGGSGDIDLEIASIEFSGRNGAEFSALPLADPVIGFGETRTLRVTFAPSSVAMKRGFIRVHHSGAGSPLIVGLTGKGSYRANAGGDPVDDWGADSPFSPGGSIGPLASGSVSGPTAPDEVFESYRFGQQAWDFPVTPGAYRVNLYFAETFPGTQSTGARQFDVEIEGLEVLTNFDIFAAAGANEGIVRGFDIVSDANLDIDFTQVVNSPAIQGIEVIPTPVSRSLGASPAEATFGSIAVGDSMLRTVRVVHLGEPGTAAVNLQRATIVGADSNQFGFISGAAARQLQPGQISAIVIGYSPNRAGVANARLSIAHDGANSPLEVDLSAVADDVILYRLNAGGDAVVGQFSWSPDDAFLVPGTPSGEFTLVEAINTGDQSLPLGTPLDMIRTERFGSTSQALAYDLPLADGTYEVRFYFVEGVHTAAGVRVFDVRVEGGLALNDLDIFARAGRNKAIMVPVRTNVTGGVLDIDFIPIAGKNLPAVHGIEVVKKVGNAVLGSNPVSLTIGPILSSAVFTGEVEIVHGGGAGIPSIVLDSVVISGPDAARFSIVGGPRAGAVFPPGASAASVIRFAPGSTGDKNANLVITYNGGSVLSVPLFGSVNDPPVVATSTDQSVSEQAPYSRTITATDPDSGDFLSMSVSGLPFWASVTSRGDGTITFGGTPGFDDAGSSTVTVTATDPDGASDAESFTLTVVNVNRPPSFNAVLPDRTSIEGDSVSISTEATDPDGDDLTWTATGLPPGTFIGSSSGLISGTIPFTAGGGSPYTVVVRVTDGEDSVTDTFVWTIGEKFLLTVSTAGSGSVTSAPAGISCGFDCSERYPSGISVTLTAAPATGWSFAGWTGAGCAAFGTSPCTLSMSVDVGVTATFTLDPVTLTVTKAGTGSGTVTSAPAGISCGGDCAGDYLPGTSVTLTPSAAAGSSFVGWTGAGCAAFGTSPCTVSMSVDVGVTAIFALDPVTLTVSKVGSGTVTSAPAGISCGGDCAGDYLPGTDVTLTAAPATGWSFAGWTGAGCAAFGTSPCTLSMSVDVGVTATFTLDPVFFTLTAATSGSGSVSSAPVGISCGGDCTEDYLSGTSVTLTPAAAGGWSFDSWSGACAGSGACVVLMDGAKSVTATFTLDPVFFTLTAAT
ncbi:MAG: malectin domain-containing carbohydrate-binding protein, partial [Acidimicrobiia bacterium]|nr:malectin domain-containing carbohydrate-binding protein [Acidimicrobiia bacterium]